MSNEHDTGTPQPAPAAPAPAPSSTPATNADPSGSQGAEKTFTQAELDQKITQRLSKQKKAMEKEMQEKLDAALAQLKAESPQQQTTSQPPVQTTDSSSQLATLQAEMKALRDDNAFEKALRGVNLADDDRDLLRSTFTGDVKQLQALASRFKAPDPEPTPAAATPAPATPAAPVLPTGVPGAAPVVPAQGGYVSPGGVGGSPPDAFELNPVNWSRDYIDTLKSEGKLREALDKYRNGGRGGSPFPTRR